MNQICNQIFAYMITGHSAALYSALESAKKKSENNSYEITFQKNSAKIVFESNYNPKIALFLGFLQY